MLEMPGQESSEPVTLEQVDKARKLLEHVLALSSHIEVIEQSLRPLKILLEAFCLPFPPATPSEGSIFFADRKRRNDLDLRWIRILSQEGLIKVDTLGQLTIQDKGIRKIIASF